MFRQITAQNITKYFNKGFSLFIVIIFQFIICTAYLLNLHRLISSFRNILRSRTAASKIDLFSTAL